MRLASGSGLRYDYLIYAVGSTAAPAGRAGRSRIRFPHRGIRACTATEDRIDEIHPSAPICVVGGGLTGIETAAEFAERGPERDVTLICGPMLGPSLSHRDVDQWPGSCTEALARPPSTWPSTSSGFSTAPQSSTSTSSLQLDLAGIGIDLDQREVSAEAITL